MRILPVFLFLSLWSCQAADDPSDTPSASLSVTLERVGSLGDETAAESFLGSPVDVATNESRIFVADRGRRSILVFDHEGTFRSRIGREGRGPGEFGAIALVWADNEQLLVFDDQFMRITRFSVDGSVISVHPYSDLDLIAAPTKVSRLENNNYLFTAGNGYHERFGQFVMHVVSRELDMYLSSFGEKEQIFGEYDGYIDFSTASTGTHLIAGDRILFSPRVYAGKLHVFENRDGKWIPGRAMINDALAGPPFTLLSSGSDLHPDRNFLAVNEDGSFDSYRISSFSHSLGMTGDSLLIHLIQTESSSGESRNLTEVYDADTGKLLFYDQPFIRPADSVAVEPSFRNLKLTGDGQVFEIRRDSVVQLNRFRLETVRESSQDK